MRSSRINTISPKKHTGLSCACTTGNPVSPITTARRLQHRLSTTNIHPDHDDHHHEHHEHHGICDSFLCLRMSSNCEFKCSICARISSCKTDASRASTQTYTRITMTHHNANGMHMHMHTVLLATMNPKAEFRSERYFMEDIWKTMIYIVGSWQWTATDS